MKQVFLLMAMLIGMIGNAQQYVYGYQWQAVSFILNTDNNPLENYMEVRDANDSLIFSASPFYVDSLHIIQTSLYGEYTVTIYDTGCDGMDSNGLVITADYYSQVIPVTGCQTSFTFYVYLREFEFEIQDDACPTDLNEDGITSVDDLLIFIGAYGEVCGE